MGQYWKAVLEQDDELVVVDPMELGSGWKLTEHSFFGNRAVLKVIDRLLAKAARVWWVGDYYNENIEGYREDVMKAAWCDCKEQEETGPQTSPITELSGYLVNHTKKEYIDMRKCFLSNEFAFGQEKGWCIEPLPLLTAVSNDLGGGDYHEGGEDYELVGTWAGDVIEFNLERPDYAERTVSFLEEGYKRVAEAG